MTSKATSERTAATKPRSRSATAETAELRRWTPEEVIDQQLLPYKSARWLRMKCRRREFWHHNDGGRITFTAEDIRRNSELGAVQPLTA